MSVSLLPAKDAFSGQPQTQCRIFRFPCYVAVPVRDPQRPLRVRPGVPTMSRHALMRDTRGCLWFTLVKQSALCRFLSTAYEVASLGVEERSFL